jgi:hypothetical protein
MKITAELGRSSRGGRSHSAQSPCDSPRPWRQQLLPRAVSHPVGYCADSLVACGSPPSRRKRRHSLAAGSRLEMGLEMGHVQTRGSESQKQCEDRSRRTKPRPDVRSCGSLLHFPYRSLLNSDRLGLSLSTCHFDLIRSPRGDDVVAAQGPRRRVIHQ